MPLFDVVVSGTLGVTKEKPAVSVGMKHVASLSYRSQHGLVLETNEIEALSIAGPQRQWYV